jgi:LmbE family N-acetylglucosaminyl deacetylase
MLRLAIDLPHGRPLEVLFLGAHSDDIEIGCGGTALSLIQNYSNICITWIVFGAKDVRAQEALDSAQSFLAPVEEKNIIIRDYKDGFFPYIGADIKGYFEELKRVVSPDLIFTHYRQDLHQDHRLICELTWNTFRDNLILEYEIPKFDGDIGAPNLFFPLEDLIVQQKVTLLMEHFKTQANRHWFNEETFLAILRLRGIESRAPSKLAEAFYGRKISI